MFIYSFFLICLLFRYQNDDWKKSKGGGGGGEWVCEEIPPETQAEWEMMSLITSQRVDNALSKIGRVSSTGLCFT